MLKCINSIVNEPKPMFKNYKGMLFLILIEIFDLLFQWAAINVKKKWSSHVFATGRSNSCSASAISFYLLYW